jgi:DNA (cytosine-5)-methyltransferase 1
MLEICANRNASQTPRGGFTFIDLFAGIGGMRKGFEDVGGQCIYSCERDKFSRETYADNFGLDTHSHPFEEDITDPEAVAKIPPHDVLLAGFPCQPFSLAGVSKKRSIGQPTGFECDTQGTLFFHVCKILETHRPAAFLLENVKNLKSHDKGKTFSIIRRSLEELGYSCGPDRYRVIDAKSFVPQHRERIFIAGFRNDTDFSFGDLELPPVSEGPRLGSILHPEDGSETPEEGYTVGSEAKVCPRYTLTAHLWRYLRDYAAMHKAKGNGFGYGLAGKDDYSRTLSARYHKDGSEILIRQRGKRPRRLTPRECARLMGFDSPGEPPFKIEVSDTQAYRQFGNSVVVPVVKVIAAHMLPHILHAVSQEGPQLHLPIVLPSFRTDTSKVAASA